MVRLSKLRTVRERKALTQQGLAKKAGINRVTIARLERGNDRPFPTTVRKLADALGVAPEDLMERETSAASDEAGLPSRVLAAERNGRLARIDTPDVNNFLRKHPELGGLVAEATDQLRCYFPDARMRLELLIDPEYGDEQLFLGASTNMGEDEANAALHRFDEEWWIDNVRRSRGFLCIDLSEA